MRFLLILVLSFFTIEVFSQEEKEVILQDSIAPTVSIWDRLTDYNRSEGRVRISADPNIKDMVDLHIMLNKKKYTYRGYRIQIYSISSVNSNVDDLNKRCDIFKEIFKNIPVYLGYFDPDFKIRIGNFRTRLEAIPTLMKIKRRYPAAYPVRVDIPISEFLKKYSPTSEIIKEKAADVLTPTTPL